MTPRPVRLLICFIELSKVPMLAMSFFQPDAVRSVFMTVPHMVVVMGRIVILVLIRTEHGGHNR